MGGWCWEGREGDGVLGWDGLSEMWIGVWRGDGDGCNMDEIEDMV